MSGSAPRARGLPGPLKLAVAWLILIVVGTILLRLPVSAVPGRTLSWLDAAFTATSGICVTGLSTITVGERLTTFGQVVLLVLIQLGGLGISVVSTFFLTALGRASLSSEMGAGESLAAVRVRPLTLLWWAIGVTVTAELAGTLLLGLRFDGSQRWWLALFHSISAFCNAGFSLFPDSLEGYRGDAVVNLTVITLIAAGGVGFIVIRQLVRRVLRAGSPNRAPIYLHTRVVLAGSLILWTLGMVLVWVLERGGTLANLSAGESVLASLFQSVTTRTAGFNTLEVPAMRDATLFVIMLLMFVGGAPGSCAGGIKLTTAFIVLAAIRSHYLGVDKVRLFRRSVPAALVQRAFLLVTLSTVFLSVVILVLCVTEEGTAVVSGRHFTAVLFEAVSAFGTVGLSTGITPHLSAAGKAVIIVTMFVGRLGPLMLIVAVLRPRVRPTFAYPEEDLAVG
ncbi:MAG: hypothetical protein D6788_11865 [Planctomycetota bacterium]|nr:MAG: hypothetical protein D6788_11865 [Planctomycetota bacterium]